MTIYHKGNGALGFYVEDGNKKDNVYINDNTVYLDGNLVLYNNIPETPAEPNSTIYKEEVSLKPYGNNLGCKYKTYCSGADDYKYIQTFYVNRNCTGAHKTTTTYAHFIIY